MATISAMTTAKRARNVETMFGRDDWRNNNIKGAVKNKQFLFPYFHLFFCATYYRPKSV